MKMHAIIVKQGFAVIAAFCCNMCLFRNPVITILKFIGCENCVRENKLALFLQFFWKKIATLMLFRWRFCTFLEQLEKIKVLRFGRI